jgi:hypothetical protein
VFRDPTGAVFSVWQAGRFSVLHDPQDAVFTVIRTDPEYQMWQHT